MAIINGTSGNDTLPGTAGNDTINPFLGQDTVDGGAGNDLVNLDYSTSGTGMVDPVNLALFDPVAGTGRLSNSAGTISLTFTSIQRFNITGTGFDDVIQGVNGNDTLRGGAGNDRLTGNGGSDSLLGGDGDDTFTNIEGVDTIDGGIGTDLLLDANFSTATAAIVFDGVTAPTIILPNGATVTNVEKFQDVRTGSGNDSLSFPGVVDNVVRTGAGDDTINPGLGQDDVDGGAGNDLVNLNYSTSGTGMVDPVNLALFDPVAGTGRLSNSAGTNSLIFTSIQRFNITGTALGDVIQGVSGNDTLRGGDGTDRLTGNGGDDSLLGGDGDDTFTNIEGVDTIAGGIGRDLILDADFSTATAAIVFDGVTAPTIILPNGATVSNVEQFKDVRTGSGNDSLSFPGVVDNVVQTGAGDDTINPGLGQDDVDGGAGNDLVNLDYSTSGTGMVDPVNLAVFDPVAGTGRLSNSAGTNSLIFTSIQRFNITGTALGDVIQGVSGNDTLRGGDGTDRLTGNGGDDSLLGGDGDDTFTNIEGVDTIAGGIGRDLILDADFSTATAAIVFDGVTAPTIILPNGVTVTNVEQFKDVRTGSGNDSLSFPGVVDNVVQTGAGDDTINPGLGQDDVDGGAGNDLVNLDYSTSGTGMVDPVNLAVFDPVAGTGRLSNSAGTNSLIFTSIQRFNITGTALGDAMQGVNGNDTLVGGGGNDTLTGNGGNDSLTGNAGNDALTGNAGNDSLDGGTGLDTMLGGLGNDTYVVNTSADVMTENPSEGTDLVRSPVTLALGANLENLTLTGTLNINGTGNGLDNAIGGNFGHNTLKGLAGNDTLSGSVGDDHLDGGTGDDSLTGALGNDVLIGGTGDDTLAGGADNDTYLVDSQFDVVTEGSGPLNGTDLVKASSTFTLGANIENLTLTGANQIDGTGNSLDNVITGNGVRNNLDGGSGNDTLVGGNGDDNLNGGAGIDTLEGGLGFDVYTVDTTTDTLIENAGEGTDRVESSVTFALGTDFEDLTLTGTGNIDAIGNVLSNRLSGNSGSNRLQGCLTALPTGQIDTLTGGGGADVFVLGISGAPRFYDDGNPTGHGFDDYALILDFEPGVDKLQLRGSASDYVTAVVSFFLFDAPGILIDKDGSHSLTADDELIAAVGGPETINLNTDVIYV